MVAKRFEFLPHTADVKFRAYGKTLEEAFSNAALALTAVMTEDKIASKIKKKITVQAAKKESLLYDFLESLLYLADTEGFLLGKVMSLRIQKKGKEYFLRAEVAGDGAEGYDVKTQIKAATYNDMFIKEEKTKVTLQVVLDI